MDPYQPYDCTSDFEAASIKRSGSSSEDTKLLPLQHQQNHLPPVREILAPHVHHPATNTSAELVSFSQAGDMTRRTFQSLSNPARGEPPSPEQSQIGANVDPYDSMSARSADSSYTLPHHQRRSSSWNATSPYADMVNPYGPQRSAPCTVQGPFQPARTSPSLPPIRDIDRMGNYDPSLAPSAAYSQPWNTPASAGPQGGQENYSYATDRPAYYDPPHRYGQSYLQTNRPSASQVEYPRYHPSPYDYRAYQPPYGSVDYTSSPTALHHPSSPTVAADDSRNRRRRGNLPKAVTDILRQWFLQHLEHPYPTEEDKQTFVLRTGLSIAQISNWFINARRRHLPALRHAARERTSQTSTTQYESEQVRRQSLPDATMR